MKRNRPRTGNHFKEQAIMSNTVKILGRLGVYVPHSPVPPIYWPLIAFWQRKQVTPWQKEPRQ